jgi:hypothetical protein
LSAERSRSKLTCCHDPQDPQAIVHRDLVEAAFIAD